MPHESSRRRERRSPGRSLAVAFVLVALLSHISARAGENPAPLARGDSKRVSVVANSVPVPRILREVAERAGIRLVLDPMVEAQIAEQSMTIAIDDLHPEPALRRLLPDSNLLLIYATDGALVEVQAYGAGGAVPAARVVARPAAPASSPPARPSAPPGATASETSTAPVSDEDRRLRERLRREAVTHPEAARRGAAIEELTGHGDEALVRDTAIEMLARDRDATVLEATLDVVSTLKSVPLEQIAQFAAGAREPALRIQALDILGGRAAEDPRVRNWLRSVSASDGDDDVRNAARMLLDQAESR